MKSLAILESNPNQNNNVTVVLEVLDLHTAKDITDVINILDELFPNSNLKISIIKNLLLYMILMIMTI